MYIKVKVVAYSREDRIEKLSEDSYRVYVRAPAERGLANSSVRDMLAREFNTNNIRLISGHTSPSKIFTVN